MASSHVLLTYQRSLPPLINHPIFRFQNVLLEKQLWFESVDTVNFCMCIAKVVVKHIASKASENVSMALPL